jgi:hypothetical protein
MSEHDPFADLYRSDPIFLDVRGRYDHLANENYLRSSQPLPDGVNFRPGTPEEMAAISDWILNRPPNPRVEERLAKLLVDKANVDAINWLLDQEGGSHD